MLTSAQAGDRLTFEAVSLLALLLVENISQIFGQSSGALVELGKGSAQSADPCAARVRATGARLSWSTITRTCAHWATASDCWPKGVAKRYPLQAAAVLAEVQAPGYRRREPEPAKGWLNRLLG